MSCTCCSTRSRSAVESACSRMGMHTAFKLTETVPYPTGVVGLHYTRA